VTADDVGVCRQMPNEIVSRNRLVQPIPVQEIGMDECEIGFREVILYEFDAAIGQVVVNGNAITLRDQNVYDMAADESSASRQKNIPYGISQ
jgi:hypothetical protein